MNLLVTGIGVVSPRGRDAVKAAESDPVRAWDGWFDHREELGRRGYKYLPPPAHHLLAAAKSALADSGASLESAEDIERGVVIGTNSAVSPLHADMDRTVVHASSDDISPAFAPFFSINLIGSRLAPEHGLKGFNVTVTSPRIAGLEAIEIGARAVALGRARWLLVGVTEAPAGRRPRPRGGGAVTGARAR
ncbi:hypothetical protein BBK82_30580 [Lentzea guizhouensis]|uniref:Beta-ketoacyl synthase-like N-terminal domain-containing protein n=1 Tax=Lentzea guizhouensis TaxID=1586287 RepID=A0A1B2HPW0_9PSEU|nr:beta-ketoacyl synthase N-terminal-like domain-containing protein [Lentzea guizhouensis]ANZ39743.1 hypothetical protein BBK82_30580 [Lentzea guizhouensis]